MDANIQIKNNEVLPVSYAIRQGKELVKVKSLNNGDEPILANAIFIGFTAVGQLLVHCVTIDLIFEAHSGLEITFV